MNLTRLSRHKRINIERHIQPYTQIRLRTDRLLIRIMTMHTCAAQLRHISTDESSVGMYVR